MACHNRANLTERALTSILQANKELGWEIKVFVVDDGSTDHTRSVIENSGLDAEIIQGSGNWYWARSMAHAESAVPSHFQAFLWCNDDVELRPDALRSLDQFHREFPEAIIVGQQLNPSTKMISFGGKKRPARFKNRYDTIESKGTDDLFDTFSGNFVLVPTTAARKIGPIDGNFAHGYADLDYGLRASKAGIRIVVPPIFFGFCLPNPQPTFNSLRQRISYLLFDKKGTPLKSQIRFYKRHGGKEWPIYVAIPFVSALLGTNSRGRTRILSNIKDFLKL